jgi:hypothetical protein
LNYEKGHKNPGSRQRKTLSRWSAGGYGKNKERRSGGETVEAAHFTE